MNRFFQKLTRIMLLLALFYGSVTPARALTGQTSASLLPPASQNGAGEPVVYETPQINGANLTNSQIEAQFGLVIYAYKQMRSYTGRSGTELVYFDINKINGPIGLTTPGSVCSSTQKADTSYYSNTVTVGYTFCTLLDAIKTGTPIYGIVPTEALFLHNSSGARLSKSGNGAATYLINPADPFIRTYTKQRFLEKITELGIEGGFSDNLQPGWSKVTSAGTPVEYTNWTSYNDAMAGFACEIFSALRAAGKEAWGNLTAVDPGIWAQYAACLDGAMAETWITDWGGFASVSDMEMDLSLTKAWVESGRKVLLIAQDSTPDTATNQFVYASSLLVGSTVARTFYKYAHYSGAYAEYYAPPLVNLGNPKGGMYQVAVNVWERSFDAGCVRVDLSAKTSQITGSPCIGAPTQTAAPIQPSPTAIVTFTSTAIPTATNINPTNINPTNTAAPIQPSPTAIWTATSVPIQPSPTTVWTATSAPIQPSPTPVWTATPLPSTPTAQPTQTLTSLPTLPPATATSIPPTATLAPKLPTETIFDDKDPGFSYSAGWQDTNKKQAYKGSYKITHTNGAYLTFTFTGTSFSILYKGGTAYRKMDVYIDGVLVGAIDQKYGSSAFQLRWDYPGTLAAGAHTLKLVFVTPNTGDGSNGSIDAIIVR